MAALDPIPAPGEPSPKKVMVRIDKFIPSDLRLLDDSCLIRYLQSIPLPISSTQIDVYEIEPGASARWLREGQDHPRIKRWASKLECQTIASQDSYEMLLP